MSSNSLKTVFQNVQITVAKVSAPDGSVSYQVTSANPQPVIVTEADTIINYQLIAPTPSDVVFTGLTLSPDSGQFSKPTISTDGKNLTLSDVNTRSGNFTRTFEFNGQPELRDSAAKSALRAPGDDIENRPPPPPAAP